eukprot:g6879.t1
MADYQPLAEETRQQPTAVSDGNDGNGSSEREVVVLVVGQRVGDTATLRECFAPGTRVVDRTLSDAELMHPARSLSGEEWERDLQDASLVVCVFDCAGARVPVLGSYGKLQPLTTMLIAEGSGMTCPIVYTGTRERSVPSDSAEAFPHSFRARMSEGQMALFAPVEAWNRARFFGMIPAPPLVVWNQTPSPAQRGILANFPRRAAGGVLSKEEIEDRALRGKGCAYVVCVAGPKGGVVCCDHARAPSRCQRAHLSWRWVSAIAVLVLAAVITGAIVGRRGGATPANPLPPTVLAGIGVTLRLGGVTAAQVTAAQAGVTAAFSQAAGLKVAVPDGGVAARASAAAHLSWTAGAPGAAAGAGTGQWRAAPAGANITLIASVVDQDPVATDKVAADMLAACYLNTTGMLAALQGPLPALHDFELLELVQDAGAGDGGAPQLTPLQKVFVVGADGQAAPPSKLKVFGAASNITVLAFPPLPPDVSCTVDIVAGGGGQVNSTKDAVISHTHTSARVSITPLCGGSVTLRLSLAGVAACTTIAPTETPLQVDSAAIVVHSSKVVGLPETYSPDNGTAAPYYAGHNTEVTFRAVPAPPSGSDFTLAAKMAQGISFVPEPLPFLPGQEFATASVNGSQIGATWYKDSANVQIRTPQGAIDCAYTTSFGVDPTTFGEVSVQASLVRLNVTWPKQLALFATTPATVTLTPPAVSGLCVSITTTADPKTGLKALEIDRPELCVPPGAASLQYHVTATGFSDFTTD